MKILLTLIVFIFLAGCSSTTAQGGGDDFPSMIEVAGVEIASVINGELLPETPEALPDSYIKSSGQYHGGSSPQSRGYAISGDTLWFDTTSTTGNGKFRDRVAFSIADSGSIYSIEKVKADSSLSILFTDGDNDGYLQKKGVDNGVIRAQVNGSLNGSFWYSGTMWESMELVRFATQYNKGELSYFGVTDDSLVVPGEKAAVIWADAVDSLSVALVAGGSTGVLEDDILDSLRLRTTNSGHEISLSVVPSETVLYSEPVTEAAIVATVKSGNEEITLRGECTALQIRVISDDNDTILFTRDGQLK